VLASTLNRTAIAGLTAVSALIGVPASASTWAAQAHTGAARGGASSAGGWGKATELPGIASLNAGGAATVSQVSCSSPGNCGLGGGYADAAGNEEGFVASEQDGTWGKAAEVPGLARLNGDDGAAVASVSCAGPGDCSAGGFYGLAAGRNPHQQAFVVTERNGTWGSAAPVPGLASLNTGGTAEVLSVSCAAPGDCGAVGDYFEASGLIQSFLVGQRDGRWGSRGLRRQLRRWRLIRRQ
jgi:hypothetical protein